MLALSEATAAFDLNLSPTGSYAALNRHHQLFLENDTQQLDPGDREGSTHRARGEDWGIHGGGDGHHIKRVS